MVLEHLQQILNAVNNKLGNSAPKSVKTLLSLIDKYKEKLTKHRKNRILKVLNKTIHDLVEMKHSNDEHFEREGLDDLVDSLIKQGEEFERISLDDYIPKKVIGQVMLKVKDIGEEGFGLTTILTRRELHSDYSTIDILRGVLTFGLLGFDYKGDNPHIESFEGLKTVWYELVRKRKTGRVFGNIIGRDIHFNYKVGLNRNGLPVVSYRGQFTIIYNLQGFKETLPYIFGSSWRRAMVKSMKTNTFISTVEANGTIEHREIDKLVESGIINPNKNIDYNEFLRVLIVNKSRIQKIGIDAESLLERAKSGGSFEMLFGNPDCDDGFIMGKRIAPKRFCALIWNNSNYGDLNKELPELRKKLNEIINVMQEVSKKTNKDRYLPIYDNGGNLWWPKRMSYEEVKAYVKSR